MYELIKILVQRVNTADSITIVDEDRNEVMRSEMGKKLMQSKAQITTAKQKQNKPTKKESLLANKDIKRWHDNLARSSIVTAEVRLRKLGKFCENNKITPMELIDLGLKRPKDVADLLEDTITTMEKKGNAPQYIKTVVTAVKSWLHHFDIEIKRKIRITNVDTTPTLADERVPEASELVELFNRANLRTGAIMSLIAKAGLRPEVLGNHNATDGLMIKDLPDLKMVKETAIFEVKPSKIVVRSTLSKAGHSYFTFVTETGAEKILAYLNQRLASGETLTPESPIIAPHPRSTYKDRKFISTAIVERGVRDAMRPRFKWRPYVLRAFFDTQLLIAESRGKIAHDFRVFFMGHKGSIEAKYTTNKSILPQLLTDEMLESFRKSQKFLDLERKQEPQKQQETQKIATVEEFQKLIKEGWQYLATLPSGGLVLKWAGPEQDV